MPEPVTYRVGVLNGMYKVLEISPTLGDTHIKEKTGWGKEWNATGNPICSINLCHISYTTLNKDGPKRRVKQYTSLEITDRCKHTYAHNIYRHIYTLTLHT